MRKAATRVLTRGSPSEKWCPGEGLRGPGREGPCEAERGREPAVLTLIATIVGTRRRCLLYDGDEGESVISDGNGPFDLRFA